MNRINIRKLNLVALKNPSRIIATAALITTLFVGVSDAGIGRNGIASGRITSFGSIFVNNRELFLDEATVTIDGQPGSGADLKLGQIVFVRGLFDDEFPIGDAFDVEFRDNVEGPIGEVDADEEQLVVLGQTILTDADTIVELLTGPGSLADLNVEDRVEISGFPTADGSVLASRVQQIQTSGVNEVTGTVDNLEGNSFTINALTVVFSPATTLINFPGGGIANGDVIEAKGSAFGENGALLVSQLELQAGFKASEDDLGEIEGLIAEFKSANEFSLAGIPVSTDENTLFVGGGASNLTTNTSIEVLGQFDGNGVLLADQVTIRGTRVRIEGPVDSASASQLKVFQISLETVGSTKLLDKSALQLKPFEITDFYVGDYAEIRSFKNPAAGAPVIAELIKRVKDQSDVRLQGFVDSSGAQHFQMYGVTIDVSADTDFTGADGKEISATEFFDVLTAGTFAVVHGNKITNTGITAKQVELALDD